MKDPVLFEIVKNALSTIGDEMGITVVRSAYSTFIKEAGDASAAMFDQEGQLVAQSRGSPVLHLGSLRPSLQEVMKDFPPETMKDGDVFLSNDPYRGGIHSNDIMVFKPVFFEGRLSFFTTALVHVADVGGVSAGGLPANATEMYHEGLILPPVKYHDGGQLNEAMAKVIAANSRTPEKVLGDIGAMIAAANVGARRLLALLEKYGYEELMGFAHELMDYAEARTRQAIRKIPPGRYDGAFTIEDDGIDFGKGFTVKAAISIEDSSFCVDFTGTDPQARGPINSSLSQSLSGVLFVLRCLIDGTIPMNEGCYRPLKVILPEGTLVNPRAPAACNGRIATAMAIIEAMLQAIAQAYPEMAMAVSGSVHVYTMAGSEPGTGRIWTYMDPTTGGLGARSTKDGVDVATITGAQRGMANGLGYKNVESYEIEYPVLFRRVRLWQDSGGPGRWRGGAGVLREVQILDSGSVTVRGSDRCTSPPAGVRGGLPGKGGGWVLNMGGPGEVRLPTKATGLPLRPGDTLTMLTSGGGGFGSPLERDFPHVLADVLDGRVSVEGARQDYGVIIDPETLVIAAEETRVLRADRVRA